MTSINTSTNTVSSASPPPTSVSTGTAIAANTFQQMLQILDDLTDHSHTTIDTYSNVCQCQCQCQCACSRGIL